MNIGHDDPWGSQWLALQIPDRMVYAMIAKRRKAPDLDERTDILSLIMRAETEEGEQLSDGELRDELMTLVLAGHETTANQLAWTWERLTRTPEAQARLVETVRAGGDDAAPFIEATVTESMRSRPVIPMTARRVTQPWQLGPYGVPADTPVAISMVLLHHRSDLYPDPHTFRPERWLEQQAGHVRVDPLRRRDPPLPRCRPGNGGDELRARADGATARYRGRVAGARADAEPQRDDDPCSRRPRRDPQPALSLVVSRPAVARARGRAASRPESG